MMTEKEYNDAASALVDWFKSQDISPADGALIMLKLLAIQLVAKTKKIDKLKIALTNANELLTIEVAWRIAYAKAVNQVNSELAVKFPVIDETNIEEALKFKDERLSQIIKEI